VYAQKINFKIDEKLKIDFFYRNIVQVVFVEDKTGDCPALGTQSS
jgi:hypothetical protein